MDILVIGGSVFVGRALAETALARGHSVTTFNRGRTGTDVPGTENVRGDRTNKDDLARLAEGRTWDAVVDVCGFSPRVVGDAVRALDGHADTYAFISSISAYPDWPGARVDENSTRFPCPPDAEAGDGSYGALKAGCERAVETGFGGRVLVVQPGLILGPYENVGRLPWWLRRMAAGGRVLAPGAPDRPMQIIDVRDLAAFVLDAVEAGKTGRYLAGGTPDNTTVGEFLGACVQAAGSHAELVWVDDQFLLDHDVAPWTELPLWAPLTDDLAGVWLSDSSKAAAEGMTCRPVPETVADTWAWYEAAGLPAELPSYATHAGSQGIDPDKEQRILAAWDAR
ncbi:MAG: NAD-dependent epimerase/dehydratase family protein [Streptomycetaceae bacterium]|nr:NAD-dependent epimerase/dehydratase family protein [Streptomycetaceae bacterium]